MKRDVIDLNSTAREAMKYWNDGDYAQAEPLFRQVVPHLDSSHYNAAHLLSCFATTLDALDQGAEAEITFRTAIRSAITCDGEKSASRTAAVLGLAEFLFRSGRYDEALEAITQCIRDASIGHWVLLYLATRIHYRQCRSDECREAAKAAYLAAPHGKFSSVESLLAQVAANDS